MKNEILVNGEHTVSEYRRLVDEASGIPGLPGFIVHEPNAGTLDGLRQLRDVTAGLEYRIQNALDGMIELVPMAVIRPPKERQNEK